MIHTEGLTHLHLCVTDLDRSLHFYTAVFGMEEQFRDGAMVFLSTPGRRDTLTLNPDPARAGARGGVDHFGFRRAPGQSLDAAVEAVEAHGGRLRERGEHPSGRSFVYVTDPDGYVIEL